MICNALTATNISTNTEITNLLTPKATTADVDGKLDLKSNQATTYTKTELDNLLTPKATVTHVNEQLALQANQATTYTKTETDNLLMLKHQLHM
jgi:hypothetical protein